MMRHAESEERLQSIRDHDRPLTDEGRSSAREVDTLTCPPRLHINLACCPPPMSTTWALPSP